MSAKGPSHVLKAARLLPFICVLGSMLWTDKLVAAVSLPSLPVDLPVTNGLIRWWPNLFDVRDEVTGQEGVVMGVLEPVESKEEDPTRFRKGGVRLQLQPAVTNEVFTMVFWVLASGWQHDLLGQETAEHQWYVRHLAGTAAFNYFIAGIDLTHNEEDECFFVAPHQWSHVAIWRRNDGTSVVWLNGKLALEGKTSHPWPGKSRWLTVGAANPFDGHFEGTLRDLSVYDRNLSSSEIKELYAFGPRPRPTRNTSARLAATAKQIAFDISTNTVTSSDRNWTHRRYNTEDGLPDNVVKAVLQSKSGYLWIGTQNGLARFDGKHFRLFNAGNTPALAAIGDTVFSISEGSSGTIWAGIFGGLLRIRNLEFTALTNGLPQRFILQAEEAADGSVWVAGFATGVPRGPMWLRRYDPETQLSYSETMVPGHIRRLIPATNGVWIATEQPSLVQFWNGQSGTPSVLVSVGITPPEVQIANRAAGSDEMSVRAWCVRNEPHYWWASTVLGNNAPVFSWLWHHESPRPWSARWAGETLDEQWSAVLRGLARSRGDQLEIVTLPDRANATEISAACANREGGIWFASEEDGLHFLQEKLVRVFTSDDGLAGNDVRSVSADQDGNVWAGSFGGLSKWQNGKWHDFGKDHLQSVTLDKSGNPWFGSAGFSPMQIGRTFSDSTKTISRIVLRDLFNDPNSLCFAKDGTLWVASQEGLCWLKPEYLIRRADDAWEIDPQRLKAGYGRYTVGRDLPSVSPVGLVEDSDGGIWLGSMNRGGLFQLIKGQFRRFSEIDGLPGKNWIPVYLDSSNSLWIITDEGIVRRSAGRFQAITEKDGLPNDSFSDLIEDKLGNYWISGKRGIHRLDRVESERFLDGLTNQVHTLTLGTRDGMLTPECSSLNYPTMARTPDGHIWVATRKGLATFDPQRVVLDTKPISSSIEKVRVNGEEALFTEHKGGSAPLILPAGSGERLEFHFSAVSLTDADRIKFRHRLDGYDTDWSPASDIRLAFYTNLRPGSYLFRVKAANGHGIWSANEARASFVIRPFFWQTTTFYIALGISGIAVALLAHLYHLRRQRGAQNLRYEQAMLNEKSRIAADMHDELGARLTQIAILGEIAKTQKTDTAKTDATLTRISQAARELTANMSELVWATNPRNDSLENLVVHLRELAAVELENLGIQPRLNFPAVVPVLRVSALHRRNLVLILKEALHNIAKHAGRCSVEITFEMRENNLILKVIDNGRGFSAKWGVPRGNGLSNMQRRASDLGGAFSVHSVPAGGTCIEAVIPLGSQAGV